jgi:hypothetical protein
MCDAYVCVCMILLQHLPFKVLRYLVLDINFVFIGLLRLTNRTYRLIDNIS